MALPRNKSLFALPQNVLLIKNRWGITESNNIKHNILYITGSLEMFLRGWCFIVKFIFRKH